VPPSNATHQTPFRQPVTAGLDCPIRTIGRARVRFADETPNKERDKKEKKGEEKEGKKKEKGTDLFFRQAE